MNPSIIDLSKSLLLWGFILLAAGCSQQPVIIEPVPEPVAEFSKSAFDDCVSSLAEPLANAANPASYHLGAKYALACLEEAPEIRNEIVQLSVMQVHALAITQLLKAGDMQSAVQQVNAFKSRYPRRDLILEDGASFVQTIELIIGQAPIEQAAHASLLNASPALKSELRRHQYWQVN